MTLTPRSSTRRSRWRYAAFAATNASLTAALIAGGGATPATASVVTNHHASFPTEGFADPALVSQWYTITNQTVAAAGFPQPVTQSDAWSVSWLAAARAVDAGRNQSFQEAAFAQALHDTLAAQVPGQQSNLDADLTSTLAAIPNGPAKSAGIARGQQQAASVLAERANDGLATAAVDIPYTPPVARTRRMAADATHLRASGPSRRGQRPDLHPGAQQPVRPGTAAVIDLPNLSQLAH